MYTLLIKTLLCVVGLPTVTLVAFGLALREPEITQGRPLLTTSVQQDAVEETRHVR